MPLWKVRGQEWIEVCKPCMYTIWGTFFNKHNFINANVLCCAYSLSHGWAFATPWSVAHQAPLSMGFPWQEYWSGFPSTPPGDLPNPGIKLRSPALQAASLVAELLGKPIIANTLYNNLSIVKNTVCAKSCPTLCDPMDCSQPGSSVLGIFQSRILEQGAISYSRGSSQPRDQTCVSCVSCVAGRFFTTAPPGRPPTIQYYNLKIC